MKIRVLNFEEFINEQKKILEIIQSWNTTFQKYRENLYIELQQKYKGPGAIGIIFNEVETLCKKPNLRYHWQCSIEDTLEFLSKKTGDDFKKYNFVFIIAEENNVVQGIAYGTTGKLKTNSPFFGTINHYFIIDEIVISANAMLSRCYSNYPPTPQLNIGQQLLTTIIEYVERFEKKHVIRAYPHHGNERFTNFLIKNNFQQQIGLVGSIYSLYPIFEEKPSAKLLELAT